MQDISKATGDPAGRRIARRNALQAEEACKIAEILAVQVRRCGLPDDEIVEIAKNLRTFSVQSLQKAYGRIDSRLTTKKTGHPLFDSRKINCLYLDESGTASFSGPEDVFALGGISMQEEDISIYIARADEIKDRFFGRTDFTFHEPFMRKHKSPFHFNGNVALQDRFNLEIQALVENTPFTVFGVGIRKSAFKKQFVDCGIDPYLPIAVYDLAIMLILERYVDYLSTHHDRSLGRVHLESIGAREDAEHQSALASLLLHGTQFVSEGAFQSWLEVGCRFSPKQGSNPSELADIVAREVFEWTRSECLSEPLYWKALSAKTYLRSDGHFGKFGIKIFPAEDIQEAVLAHRIARGALPKT